MRFFRKIRQKLLLGNKLGKYLPYAIGEIFLLVIGILIALQINNWNQRKQNQKLELEYLSGLKTNLNDDIVELSKLFETDTIILDAYTFLVKTLNNSNYTSKQQELASALYNTARLHWFEGNNVIFEDLKYSGKLIFIQSDSIRHSIQTYYRFFEEVIKQENMNNSRIIIYRDRYAQKIKLSQLIESTFGVRWNGNTDAVDLSVFDTPEFSNDKDFIIENFSQIKSWQLGSHTVRVALYNRAISLKNQIEKYLEEKE